MDNLFLIWFGAPVRLFRSRGTLVLENLALRQQLAVLKRRHPRPRLDLFDKLFWVIAHQFWSTWKEALILVTPETVVLRHRTGFRFYWRLSPVAESKMRAILVIAGVLRKPPFQRAFT
jgi:hypothetical protein